MGRVSGKMRRVPGRKRELIESTVNVNATELDT